MLIGMFWLSAILLIYEYFGYPLLLWILTLFRPQQVYKGDTSPSVSVIVAGHNEEEMIREKIENCLSLQYSGEIQFIFASDGSTDGTEGIVREYANRGVELVSLAERGGKEMAQQAAIKRAKGEILVFTDVAVMLRRDGLTKIVRPFADPSVGCVSSIDRIVDNPGGEGTYVRYEMFLRRLESAVCSLVGLSGSFFAVRASLAAEWSVSQPSDFATVIRVVLKGFRGVHEPEAIGYYRSVRTSGEEFRRKVRTVLRGISALMSHIYVLNPLRFGFFSVEVFSHKLLRWAVPFLLTILFFANVFVYSRCLGYQVSFISQVAFYVLAIVGNVSGRARRMALFRIPSFFVMVQGAIAVAWSRFFLGKRMVAWEPSSR